MFKGKKIAIFYNFVAELEMLKNTFGQNLTTDLDEFNETNKNIALQIVSGREGISLAKADCLVMFNIQFSAVSYFQSRDRLTTKDRKENNVFWVFSNGGIEEKIYKSVLNKTDYTNSIFKKDYGLSTKNDKTIYQRRL
jgi:archaellin